MLVAGGPAKGPIGYANANAAVAVQLIGLGGLHALGFLMLIGLALTGALETLHGLRRDTSPAVFSNAHRRVVPCRPPVAAEGVTQRPFR